MKNQKWKLMGMGSAALLATALTISPALSDDHDGDWPSYAGDKKSSRYMAGGVATPESVKKMKIAWRFSMPGNKIVADNPDLRTWVNETTPIAIDGIVYTSSPTTIASAIDGATGKTLWTFDPEAWRDGAAPNLGSISRGITYVEEGGKGYIILATSNGFLYKLDAKTGKNVDGWGDDGSGRIDITNHRRNSRDRSIITFSSPPIICGGMIVPSTAVLDSFAVGKSPLKYHPAGDVPAFDVKTGKNQWTFFNPPKSDDEAAGTWGNKSNEFIGGTNMWARPACDEEAGIVYMPMSTPANDFYGGERPGDNLYSETLVALNVKTGKRAWHFQMVHHGLWDYDLPTAPNLMDITVNGKKIKAAAQVTKQGFIYTFDRITGKPVWPIEERKVPKGDVAGEHYAETQPFPTKPKPFVQQGASEDDLIDFTPELRAAGKKILDRYVHGPLFTPPSEKKAGTLLVPGVLGGASWAGAAHNPKTGMLYVPSFTIPFAIKMKKEAEGQSAWKYVGTWAGVGGPDGLPLFKPPYSTISAVDMNTGDYKWQVPAGIGPVDHPAIKAKGIKAVGVPHQSFIAITDDIIFTAPNGTYAVLGLNNRGTALIAQNNKEQAESALYAYSAKDGKLLGSVDVPLGVFGAIMTYKAKGKQYVILPVGGAGTPSELVAVEVGG